MLLVGLHVLLDHGLPQVLLQLLVQLQRTTQDSTDVRRVGNTFYQAHIYNSLELLVGMYTTLDNVFIIYNYLSCRSVSLFFFLTDRKWTIIAQDNEDIIM